MGLLRAPSGSAGWKIGHSCYPIHTPLHWVGGKMSKWLGNIAKVIQSLIGTLESTVLGIEAKIDGWTRSFCHLKKVNFKVPPFFKVGPSNYTCGTSGGNILRFWKKIFFRQNACERGYGGTLKWATRELIFGRYVFFVKIHHWCEFEPNRSTGTWIFNFSVKLQQS